MTNTTSTPMHLGHGVAADADDDVVGFANPILVRVAAQLIIAAGPSILKPIDINKLRAEYERRQQK